MPVLGFGTRVRPRPGSTVARFLGMWSKLNLTDWRQTISLMLNASRSVGTNA
jgi:hypothetical protein